MDILVGCDPEVFVKKDGVFKSAYGLIQGTKKRPFPVPKGAVQVDGMALEFNISPAKNSDEFCINVQDVFLVLKSMVPDYEVVAVPVADFSEQYMKEQPEEAIELGCDPDFNGWTMRANDTPDGSVCFRTAAGHVHIGWTEGEDVENYEHRCKCAAVARQMDFFLGLPSLFYDNDVKRRELYGKAGAFRPKPYGSEYRTLSNAWLSSKELIKWVFESTKRGMDMLINGTALEEEFGDVQTIINTSDLESAEKIILKANIEVPNV